MNAWYRNPPDDVNERETEREKGREKKTDSNSVCERERNSEKDSVMIK